MRANGVARGVFPIGSRCGPPPARKGVGAAGDDELESVVVAPGQARRIPMIAGRDLQLIHRGYRHNRPETGQDAAWSNVVKYDPHPRLSGSISLQVCANLALWLGVMTYSRACSKHPLDGGRTTFGACIVLMDLRLSKRDGISSCGIQTIRISTRPWQGIRS
jgi:hypothetical protein